MIRRQVPKTGFTLLELLVVLAIIAVVMGLLLVAVQRVREAAALVENKNNHRQIALGIHQLASENGGAIVGLVSSNMKGREGVRSDAALFYRLVPYVHGPRIVPKVMNIATLNEYHYPAVKVFKNNSDPSWNYDPVLVHTRGKCSYAYNIHAMDGGFDYRSSIPDGTSNTIVLVDKYAEKSSKDHSVGQVINTYTSVYDPVDPPDELVTGERRTTFADRGWGDVVPVVDPNTGRTVPSVPGRTFQVRPRPETVNHQIPQTPHSAGLTVAYFDGSVRSIAPGVDPSVFWSQVTPAGGEVIPDF